MADNKSSTNPSAKARSRNRRPKPPRPRSKLTYQVPPIPSLKTTSPNDPNITSLTPLRQKTHLLHLLIRRNKNQHRNQPFFKPLSLLHRNLQRLLQVQIELAKVQAPSSAPASTSASTSTAPAPALSASEIIRQRFVREARLRSERDILTSHLREHIAPKCYVAFSGLISDTQFANLGIVLLSLLAGVVHGEHGLGAPQKTDVDATVPVRGVNDVGDERVIGHGQQSAALSSVDADVGVDFGVPVQRSTVIDDDDVYTSSLTVVGVSTRVTGEDQGEVIQRVFTPILGSDAEPMQDGEAGEDDEFGGFVDEQEDIPLATTSEVGVGITPDRDRLRAETAARNIDKTSTTTAPINTQRTNPSTDRSSGKDRQSHNQTSAAPAKEKPSITSEKKTKKKKKGKSTIDDLFAGLT